MTRTINFDEIQPGDLLHYGGQPHRITDVVRRDGMSWPVARDGTGWAIALDHRPVVVWRD